MKFQSRRGRSLGPTAVSSLPHLVGSRVAAGISIPEIHPPSYDGGDSAFLQSMGGSARPSGAREDRLSQLCTLPMRLAPCTEAFTVALATTGDPSRGQGLYQRQPHRQCAQLAQTVFAVADCKSLQVSDNLNPALRDLARRNQTAFLNALASVSQTRVAEMLGVSESMVSRKKADIEEFCLRRSEIRSMAHADVRALRGSL